MTVEEYFIGLLNSSTALVSLIGDRVGPMENTQNDGRPRVTYEVISSFPVDASVGDGEIFEVSIDVECFGETYAEAKNISELVRALVIDADDSAVVDSLRDLRDDGTRRLSVMNSFRLWFPRG